MSKLASRYRRRSSKKKSKAAKGELKRNPPLMDDLLTWVAPGFAGFAATRLLTRVIQTQVAKRFPKHAKHAGAVASLGSFASAWWLGGRWSPISKYHAQVTVGSAIAACQSLLQIYAPKVLGWMVSDATPQLAAAAKPVAAPAALPEHMEEIADDPSWYTYNDAYDGGRYAGSLGKAPPQASAAPQDTQPADVIEAPQEGDEELAAGIFGG